MWLCVLSLSSHHPASCLYAQTKLLHQLISEKHDQEKTNEECGLTETLSSTLTSAFTLYSHKHIKALPLLLPQERERDSEPNEEFTSNSTHARPPTHKQILPSIIMMNKVHTEHELGMNENERSRERE